MKLRVILIPVLGLLGAGLGLLLSLAGEYGWLATRWQPIHQPPEDVKELLATTGDSLWIRGESGAIWELEAHDGCDAACWKNVEQVPAAFPPDRSALSVDAFACAPPRPLIGVRDSVGECRWETWLRRNSVFALRGPRSILHWETDMSMEWAFMNELCATTAGALAGAAVAMGILLASHSKTGPPDGSSQPAQTGVYPGAG